MKTIDTGARHNQLRKAAILVATLGEPLGEQLLADLPPRDAAEVRELVSNLDEINPVEYESLMADFRAGNADKVTDNTTQPQIDGGVELDASLLARLESADEFATTPPSPQADQPWHAVKDIDAETLAEVLTAEQPQTIAVVLARLEPAQAAILIAKLPPALQVDVLSRLSDLDPADEQSLQVVESQLAAWINDKQRQKQRMAAGCDLVQRILQDTPDKQRAALMEHLGTTDPSLADRLRPTHSGPSTGFTSTAPRIPSAHPPAAYAAPTAKSSIDEESESLDPLSQLEALDDQALLQALQSADRQTVMLALAGASESFMKRIVRGLPRRQANQFRRQVRTIGPTRLSDIVAAQRELVRHSKV